MQFKEKQDAFMELFEPQRKRLSAFALALTRNYEEAKDLVGEAVLKTYENFDKIKNRNAFASYLFTVAVRINKRKNWRKKLFGAFDQGYAESIPTADSNPELKADVQALYRALAELPEKQKEAVILFEISGFSIEEITEIQGGTQSGVKSRLRRGREALSILLMENEHKPAPVKIFTINNDYPSSPNYFESINAFSLRVENEKF